VTDTVPSVDLTRPDGSAPERGHLITVCCSGGGIRSASFNLGALQELAAQGVLDYVDEMCAVSGGSYMAASHTLVAACSQPSPRIEDVYSPGSPEEKWLRGNSRYLLPDARVALYGGVRLLFGIAVNLLFLLAWIFIASHALGWYLSSRDLLGGLNDGDPFSAMHFAWVLPAVLAAAGLLLTLLLGEKQRWGRIAWLLLIASVVLALGVLVAPRAIEGLYETGIHNDGPVGTIVRSAGFASPAGCAAARKAHPDPGTEICGVKTASTTDTADQAPHGAGGAGGQGGGFLVFVGAIGAVVRLMLGKLRGDNPTSTLGSLPKRIWDFARRRVLPWIGSLLVAGGLVLVGLRWIADGAIVGFTGAELAKVLFAVGLLVVGRLALDVNHTSMHGFYRDRLAFAYGVARRSRSSVVGMPDALLSELGVTRPHLVVCAAANVNVGIADDEVPPGRDAISFTFTPSHIGLTARAPDGTASDTAHVPGRADLRVDAALYERVVGRSMTLFDAVALSGAAVSPVMGKMTRPPQRFLFALANVRLGLWLPNPRLVACAADRNLPLSGIGFVDRVRIKAYRSRIAAESVWSRMGARLFFRFTQPNIRLLMAEAFGHHRVRTSWLYVTDGGHFENLGLVEALRRGATELFVFDASGDAVTSWNTLGEAIALARAELGVEIDIEPEKMVRDGHVVQPYVHGTFTYTWDDDRPHGIIHLVKLGVWQGAPWDVQAYASRHPNFPCDSTIQQMYDDEEFEAYRALGRAATHSMLESYVPVQSVSSRSYTRS
jgi:hypothetical protein